MAINIFRNITEAALNYTKNGLRAFSAAPSVKKLEDRNRYCIISCKRSSYNHYSDTIYEKFKEIPLASKGWNHGKSKDDFFTINPRPDDYVEDPVSFESLGINPALINVLKREKIEAATPFQAQVMPQVFGEKHLMLAAETGCGKTLSYLLPIVQNLANLRQETRELNTPQAVILVPNRELAYQVGEVAQILSEAVDLHVKIIVGGGTKKKMMNPEFSEIDILVGTPGAIGKLSSVGIYRLNEAKYLVLDEADTLVDDSFIERLTGILKKMPESRVLLVAATKPRNLPDVLAPIQENMREIVSPKLHKPLFNISQKFMRLTRSAKPSQLLNIAKTNKHPMLVFTNRNETSNWLAQFLRENHVPCSNINGDMHYAIRIEQWNAFIRGETQILSSTDVASRGLDTTQVRHVLNYDFPIYAADYLHRIGRVGRLGSSSDCKATNFISGPEEIQLLQEIEFAVRTNQALLNVDGNITRIVQRKIQSKMRQNV